MAKAPTLTTISSGYASTTTLNDNFEAVSDAFENTLSLDGSTPNAMEADLDMGNNDLLNASSVYTDNMYIGGTKVTSTSSVPSWQGAWVTATAYSIDDMVSNSGSSYICIEAHTSGTFATDLAATKWAVLASKGTAGAGTGDMLAANNLSDVADITTANQNLGLEKGVDVQAYSDVLLDIAGLTQGTDKIPYFDSATTAALLDFVDEDTMTSDSATAIPSQQSVKAYVDTEITSAVSGIAGVVPGILAHGHTTRAGNLSSATWTTIPINALTINSISGASLASNKITLPAGTYYTKWFHPFSYAGSGSRTVRTRLYNVSDAAVEIAGQADVTVGENYSGNQAHGIGTFTLAGSKDMRIEGYSSGGSTAADKGLYLEIWKTA
jgi:hypothetical protein